MASISLTLAALATSAVPGVNILAVRGFDCGSDFAAAVVSTENHGELLVRVPRSHAAEVRQSAQLLGLSSLTEGARRELPFVVPETLGVTRAGETRAVVTSFVDGGQFDADDLHPDALLLQPIAEALTAIHRLPRTIAKNGGLPVRSARDTHGDAVRLIDRAESTRMVPETLLKRWREVLANSEVWDFTPTVTHGSLSAGHLIVTDDTVSGVLGWSDFGVGDPATDLAWLFEAGIDTMNAVLARYLHSAGHSGIGTLRTRAALYHELEVARWLLHGQEAHDDSVVSDAVSMLDRLVTSGGFLGRSLGADDAHPSASAETAEKILATTPDVVDRMSETAAYEALDEDRMFVQETDVIEPLAEPAREAAVEEVAEHPTEPIDAAELPEPRESGFGAGDTAPAVPEGEPTGEQATDEAAGDSGRP